MGNLSFYDVDKDYIKYLQDVEKAHRGFTRVPDMTYNGEQKFLCGIVLIVENFDYYVPVTSYKIKQSENILIEVANDKYNKIKGSLRFNFMFPVPRNLIKERIIKNESNISRRMFLNAQLNFCNDNTDRIFTQAKRTYQIITKQLNKNLLDNACDFKLLEQAYLDYCK